MADEPEVPAGDEPPDGGQSPEAVEATEPEEFPSLDVDEYGNHTVRVKVNGEEQTVPLNEALNGYQRTADYTRKTQELAAEREALNAAKQLHDELLRDPQGTLAQLQAVLGPQQAAEEPPADPVQAKLAEFDQWRQQQELQAATQQIRSDLAGLHDQFGEFDDEAVMRHALELDTNNLQAAYLSYQYQFDQAQKAAEAALAASNGQAETSRTEAKTAAGFVEGGSSVPVGATSVPSGERPSLEAAFKAALDQLG